MENGFANFPRLGPPCAYVENEREPCRGIWLYLPKPMEGMDAPVFNLKWSGTDMVKQ